MSSSSTSYVIQTTGKATPKELPIGRDANELKDAFYRYKMHQLIIQVVGKGKMIKTVMLNLTDVANELKVPADYIPHYMAKTIGATAHYDEKKPERERGSISGEYDISKLSEVLQKFVKAFVVCPNCNYPELQYNPVGAAKPSGTGKGAASENTNAAVKNIKVKCMSCGWKSDVKGMDLNEKFRRYILNHPPPKPVSMVKPVVEKSATTTTTTTTSSSSKKSSGGNGSSKESNGSSGGAAATEWLSDTSKEAVKKRAELVPQNLQALVASAEGEDVSFAQILRNYLNGAKRNSEEVITEVARISSQGGLDPDKRTALIVDGFIGDNLKAFGSEVVKNRAVIEKYVTEIKGQQVVFLREVERCYAEEKSDEVKTAFRSKLKDVLYWMQNEGLLEEEAVFEWYEKADTATAAAPAAGKKGTGAGGAAGKAGKQMREAVADFVKWLKEAEEEEGEDDEEEGEKAPEKTLDEEIDDL